MPPISEAPQPNPILSAYESFYQNTPYVTRSILTIFAVSYLVSWFFNLHFALANIPQFSLFKFEIYRFVLSSLVNSSLLNLIFAYFVFTDRGKRLENSMGSAAFAALCLTTDLLVNVLFAVISVIAYYLSGDEATYLTGYAEGVWLILFCIVAIEAVKIPRGSTVPFFFTQVPALYYPVILYLFFSLLSAHFSLGNLLSVGMGYAFGFDYLDPLLVGSARVKRWEETILAEFVNRQGWVGGLVATGSGAWALDEGNDMQTSSLPLFQRSLPQGSITNDESRSGSVFRSVASESNSIGGEGHVLGGTTRRLDPRTARLQALERNAASQQE